MRSSTAAARPPGARAIRLPRPASCGRRAVAPVTVARSCWQALGRSPLPRQAPSIWLSLAAPPPSRRRSSASPRPDQHEDDRDHAGRPIRLAWKPRLYMSSASTRVASPGPARGQHEDQVEEGQRPHHHQRRRRDDRVLQLRQRDAEELADASRAVDLRRLVHGAGDLPNGSLVDEGVERDELPGHDEDDDAQREVPLAEPVLRQQRGAEACAEPEVGVEQRLEGDGDGRRAQQQRDEAQHPPARRGSAGGPRRTPREGCSAASGPPTTAP